MGTENEEKTYLKTFLLGTQKMFKNVTYRTDRSISNCTQIEIEKSVTQKMSQLKMVAAQSHVKPQTGDK